MTFVTVDHVSHSYESQEVLHDLSFKVSEGGRLVLLGESGSGKTTLLRLIAGIEQPTRGRVLYDDVPLGNVDPMTRNIGMVFQNYALIPHWDSERTIGFFLSLRKRQREVPERIQRVANITGVGLDKLMARTPSKLSGGEKQQVAIARAFARDLSLLLLDEPFANLDAKLRATARLELHRLLQEFPITTILVTHDQTEAASLDAGILLLRDGRIEQFGTYESLRDNPDSLFVARFIGNHPINVFDGSARDGQWTHPLWGSVALPQPLADGTPVTLAIRPEQMTVSATGVSGRITQLQPFFSLRRQLVELERDDMQWNVEIPLSEDEVRGDMLTTAIIPAGALFFTGDGRRLA